MNVISLPTTQSTETLDELEAQLELIFDYLESDNPNDRTVAEQLFEELLPRLEKKIDSYVATLNRKQNRADFRHTEAKRIHSLAVTDYRAVNWLKGKLLAFMERRVETLGEKSGRKLEGLYCQISLCTNGGKQPVWIDPDLSVDDFPPEYIIQVPTLNIEKLKEDALAHGEIRSSQGRLIAKVNKRSKHIRIS
ncbi:MAG TPA: hypothetical protein DCL61_08500 [Cyanobacteria bacterium UBA12227]|nr:hypothetical protein [Cyanobacteria bacterium UBA12227]HAX86691.1 hypothetical protein [Cyanobacteria bacterium UBA11370]HBY81732.1 hypothetical protein [Cyanobacteria bacterium UBA11148]